MRAREVKGPTLRAEIVRREDLHDKRGRRAALALDLLLDRKETK